MRQFANQSNKVFCRTKEGDDLTKFKSNNMAVFTYLVIAFLYAYMMYLGFYYLEVDSALVQNFLEVGWENYNGPDIDSPENSYYAIWVVVSLMTTLFIWWRYWMGRVMVKLEKILGISSLLLLAVFIILYFGDGDASIKESKFFWVFAALFQIVLSIGICFYTSFSRSIDRVLKYLYGLNAVAYVAALALGYYFQQWDNAILADIESVGWENYNGIDKDVPENSYHLGLMLLNIASLLFSWWDNEKNRVRLAFKGFSLVFFLYSAFVYINDGNPDMTETSVWWNILSMIMIALSAYLFYITKDKLPQQVNPNILDDLSGLE